MIGPRTYDARVRHKHHLSGDKGRLTQGGLIVTPSQDGFLSSMNSAADQYEPITPISLTTPITPTTPISPIKDHLWNRQVTHSRTLAPPESWTPNTSGSLRTRPRSALREGQNRRSSLSRCSCHASALQSVLRFLEWLRRKGVGVGSIVEFFVKSSDSLVRCWVGFRTLDGLERRGDNDALDTGTIETSTSASNSHSTPLVPG